MLVIDRGVYFNKFDDAQRATLSELATSSGSYIRLENGLRAQAIEKADGMHQEIRAASSGKE